ncbi:MAG TPA: TIGR03617 family F420-dependent LLM class oxidoreductase [Myxococcales bacterium]|nr:TIGR03617 family F420-dependent LLM class oxidoreductase [Myxococcales bacterium]
MRVETGIPLDNWRKVSERARQAEESGFDGVLSAEIAHDPFMPLGFAALATERIRLATAIAVCFPRSPMVVAGTAWDLQEQSGGRFVLGLGAQVKGHNERRFSVPWSPPVPRIREYVESLRAIWKTWETGEELNYQGDHYAFTLMTPEFSPKPTGLRRVPVTIAAVGPAMIKLAGKLCDGVRLHGFATRKYLEQVALPMLDEGLAASGRKRSEFEIWGGGFIATGPDEEAVAKQIEWVRYRLGFYGSTRSYHNVFAVHGWEDLGMKLHAMSKQGRWNEMAAEVSDDVVHTFAAVATHENLSAAVEKRFGGLVDSVTLEFDGATAISERRDIIQDVRRIGNEFQDFPSGW